MEKSRENEEYYRKIRQAIKQEFHETSEKLKNMSDEELIEGVFSFGTTFLLDGVILKAGTLAATIEGRALLSQWADALNSPFAKEYVLEAAGVGKLTLEEGADVATMAIEVVEKNPKLIQTEGSFLGATKHVVDVEKLANKIRKVGDDILDLSETAGWTWTGRTCGTNESVLLIKRAMEGEVSGASSFTNTRTAINAAKENLRNNAKEIAEWLKNDSVKPKAFDFTHENPIGYGVPQGKKYPNL